MEKKRPLATARNKMMDYLARRDHSEKELRQKLKERYSPEEINRAIEYAYENKWIPEGPVLSQKAARTLSDKGKGIRFINQYLKQKGLPPVATDHELEFEKALDIIRKKLRSERKARPEEKAKLTRFLLSRGFSGEVIRKALK
jgi:regulatory protein